MPMYKFRCKTCEKEFDKLVFGFDSSNVECSHCKSKDIEKLLSAPSLGQPQTSSGGCGGGSGFS